MENMVGAGLFHFSTNVLRILYHDIKQISPTLGCLTFSMIRSFKDTCVATSTLACLVWCFPLIPFSFNQITKPSLNWSELVDMTTARCHCEEGWKGEECNVRLDECEVVISTLLYYISQVIWVSKYQYQRDHLVGQSTRLSSPLSSLPLSLPALPTSLKMISNDYRLWGLFYIDSSHDQVSDCSGQGDCIAGW